MGARFLSVGERSYNKGKKKVKINPLKLDQNQKYQYNLMVFNKYTGQYRNI